MVVKNPFSTYVCYVPDGLFWLNLYIEISYLSDRISISGDRSERINISVLPGDLSALINISEVPGERNALISISPDASFSLRARVNMSFPPDRPNLIT